jgi:nitroimidazol reductase NimA-like FMN-containing flavoprotein (pyridoxamine 5'-phosphate oxidase superfamily)
MDEAAAAEHALSLLANNAFLTLGTADAGGRPWTTPVFFASDGLTDVYWTSSQLARHSRNLTERPEVSLVVFDSTVEPYHGRAVYAAGTARELDGNGLRDGLGVYSAVAPTKGARSSTMDKLTGPSPLRLYAARLSDVWILCQRAPMQPCEAHGRDDDHRQRVTP